MIFLTKYVSSFGKVSYGAIFIDDDFMMRTEDWETYTNPYQALSELLQKVLKERYNAF